MAVSSSTCEPVQRTDCASPLRIALISPVWYPVPPPRYGGTERIVSLLADGLADAGHDVTLFGLGRLADAGEAFLYL